MRVDELLVSDELSKDDRARFVAAVNDPSISVSRLATAMQSMQVRCSPAAIKNWRAANDVGKSGRC